MSTSRQASVSLDYDAIRHNFAVAKAKAPHSRVMSVVKANAYGHGVVKVVKALYESDGFAVANVFEALQLRQHGVTKPILVLQGAHDLAEYRIASSLKMTLVIHDQSQLHMHKQFDDDHPDLWLKVDTGMHRFGFSAEDISAVMQQIGATCSGLMTHFSDADDPDNDKTAQQTKLFDSLGQQYSLQRSAANSAAVLSHPDTHYDWVRPGLMLYGVTPFLHGTGSDLDLRPAMTLSAPVVATKQLQAGDTVGYGSEHVCANDTRVACVAVGYGDGYPHSRGSQALVLVNGLTCPVLGRVSMDSIVIDISRVADCAVGDQVTLWGADLPVERLAQATGAFKYALLCGVG